MSHKLKEAKYNLVAFSPFFARRGVGEIAGRSVEFRPRTLVLKLTMFTFAARGFVAKAYPIKIVLH